jgi:type VI secretion system protein ImpL
MKGSIWTVVFTLLGLIALSVLIWFVGPLAGYGDTWPLEGAMARAITIGVIWLIAALVFLIRWLVKRRKAAKLEQSIAEGPGDDTPILKEKLNDALATLKRTSGRGGSAFLYDLPWYIIIGPPGSGKTTALVNSGLKFPLAGSGGAKAIAGVGGTRHCDWWFTEEAVMIDTAGRYTTQDSDSEADRRSWTGFLEMLQSTRPRQPINGALVAVSVEDLMRLDPQEQAAHAAAIRRRLDELHQKLKISFPVYLMLTKMDLVAGFTEFFGDLTPEQRQMVWGTTFQPKNKTDNMVGAFGEEFDALMDALSAQMTDRLQQEPDARARARIFGFPAQMASLKAGLNDFLSQVFESTRYQSDAALRGVYFTSGTQEGTPIDRVIGALSRSFGAKGGVQPTLSGTGKSYFLTDLLRRVAFHEQGWVSTNLAHVRRKFILKTAAYVALVTGVAVMSALWVNSYRLNSQLLAETDRDIDEYRELSANYLQQAEINDGDLAQVLPLLQKLRYLRAGYATLDEGVPMSHGLGLNQFDRLADGNSDAYRDALERLMLPRMVWRLERQLEKNVKNPIFVYEGLKVYLMLGGQAKMDPELVTAWITRDWVNNLYPGAGNAGGREALLQHLAALIERPSSAVPLNGPLVSEAQRTLARMPVADRAYTLMKTRGESVGYEDWIAAERGGPDAGLVFETTDGAPLDTVRIPGFFSYTGFHDGVLGQMEAMVERARDERWVLGEAGVQDTIEVQFKTIRQDIMDRYRTDFIQAWDTQFGRLKIASVGGGSDLTVMSALGAPTSPLKQILGSLRKETEVTKLPEGAAAGAEGAGGAAVGNEAQRQSTALTTTAAGRIGLGLAQGAIEADGDGAPLVNPGERIEAHFKQMHEFAGDAAAAASGAAPVDQLIRRFNNIYEAMNTLNAGLGGQAQQQATQAMQSELTALESESARMPAAVAKIAKAVAGEVQGVVTGSSRQQLNQAWGQIVNRCQQISENRYPFYPTSVRDVPLPDFAGLFGPGGLMNQFYGQHLAGLVNQSGATWEWRQDIEFARTLSNDALRQFQRAAEIRDAFFASGAGPKADFSVLPVTLSPDAYNVTLDVEGTQLVYEHGMARRTTMSWPGPQPQRSSVALTPAYPGEQNELSATGIWSLHRLIDKGAVLPSADGMSVSFRIGGREASFIVSAGSVINPFSLGALSNFRCPRGF